MAMLAVTLLDIVKAAIRNAADAHAETAALLSTQITRLC
jgi:aspartate/glutamate racemase